MTYGSGWTPPPPPPRPLRRYSTRWIWFGVGLGIAATIGFPLLGLAVAGAVEVKVAATILFLTGLIAPLLLGIVFTVREGTPARRGLGLGLIIGWAVAPIVFAGLCILVIFGAYTFPSSF